MPYHHRAIGPKKCVLLELTDGSPPTSTAPSRPFRSLTGVCARPVTSLPRAGLIRAAPSGLHIPLCKEDGGVNHGPPVRRLNDAERTDLLEGTVVYYFGPFWAGTWAVVVFLIGKKRQASHGPYAGLVTS